MDMRAKMLRVIIRFGRYFTTEWKHRDILASMAVFFICQLCGCSGSEKDDPEIYQRETGPFAEIIQQGIARYLGAYESVSSEKIEESLSHSFDADDGPRCMYGEKYKVTTRDIHSEDLMIFLPGGGACWSEHCSHVGALLPGMPKLDILDMTLSHNPVKAWNVVVLPYCDGSMFSGDIDLDLDGDGLIDRYHRGLKNLSAGLDLAIRFFPSPNRILIAGYSAGGFATAYALPLVRYLYPGTPIYVINDSGVGILPHGMLKKMMSEWRSELFIPNSCPGCLDEHGHLTNYYAWQLSQDKNFRLAMMSYTADIVMAEGMDNRYFERQLITEMAELERLHPQRMRSFIANGQRHTFLPSLMDVSVGKFSEADWIAAMLENSSSWVSVSE